MLSINIIYDNRRPERYEPLINELYRQRIKSYRIVPPIEDTSNVVRSINLTHKYIVRWAKDLQLPEVCIMEDDVCFPAIDGWNYFLKNKPKKYKLYTACNYLKRDHPICDEIVGFHCYMIHESYYDDFLSLPEDAHIDNAVKGIDIHVCYPYAALQRPGWSSNNQCETNYNAILNTEDVYGQFR